MTITIPFPTNVLYNEKLVNYDTQFKNWGNPFLIEKINNNIFIVFTEDGFTTSNAILVDDDIRLMIDSGVGNILPQVNPEKIEILINSHCHIDHINGNDHFTNATIMSHSITKEAMLDPEMTTATKGWDELMDTDRQNMAHQVGLFNPRFIEPWIVDKELFDGEIIDCGMKRIKVLHTPGHTRGHCCFFFVEEGFIFTADICLSKVGPWYGAPDTKINDFIDSVNMIIDLEPEMLATSHLNIILKKNIKEELKNYIDRIYKREEGIISHLKNSPMTINDLCEKNLIYEEHPNDFVVFWEKCMIRKHLEKLIEEDIVLFTDEKYHLK